LHIEFNYCFAIILLGDFLMRKYLYILTVFLFILSLGFVANSNNIFAGSSEPIFYRITAEDTILYRVSTDEAITQDAVCKLPTTYFVKPNKRLDDDYLLVSYLGVQGAAKISDLTPVYSTPDSPYSVQTFDLLKTANATVWELPTTESTYLASIPYDATDILYIGSVDGQKTSSLDLGIWYLCKFAEDSGTTQIGYIHSSLATNLTPFESNTETVQLEPTIEANANILAPELSNTNNLLIILLLTIPAVIILLLIIKPKRSKKQTARRQIKSLNQISLPDKNNPQDFDF